MTANALKYSLSIVSGLFLFLLLPGSSQAYFTTNQAVYELNDTTVLYTIDFEFGSDLYEIHMPIMAVEKALFDAAASAAGYALVDAEEDVVTAPAHGMVLSTAAIEGLSYVIPRGESRTFTLAVLADLSLVENTDLALQVTALPFTLTPKSGGTSANHLNESELVKYRTPAASF